MDRIELGLAASSDYFHDPRHLIMAGSRYKFCSRMVDGLGTILEVGCGDGFEAPILAQGIQRLICTDIDEDTLADNRRRYTEFPKLNFQYHDFRKGSFSSVEVGEGEIDAACLIDVIEHVFPHEEENFMRNIVGSLSSTGILIVGTPNIAAEKYSSENSREQHVNLKDASSLRGLCEKFFNSIFMFSMNDEVVHTGYYPMSHYLWALCAHKK